MKESPINRQRAIVTSGQSPVVAQPSEGALDDPPPLVAPQRSAILCRRLALTLAMLNDRFNPATTQLLAHSVAIGASVHGHPHGFLYRSSGAMPPSYADPLDRFLDELDVRRGCRVKVVSQSETLAIDHHHPLCPLARLGLSDSVAPFFAGAKLPSANNSLHASSCRGRQVEREGNSSGKSHQLAPLRSIHKIPSSTLRSSFGGVPLSDVWVVWGARAGAFPIGRRSTAARIAPSALPRRV